MFDFPKPDPAQSRRILDSIYPSDFFPTKGQYFRIRAATIADRSWMGDIWLCLASQDHCAVGKRVLDGYGGLESPHIGGIRSFVAGDVIFYDCTAIWAAVEEERMPKPQPGFKEGSEVTADE
jgi:hypothetical protein